MYDFLQKLTTIWPVLFFIGFVIAWITRLNYRLHVLEKDNAREKKQIDDDLKGISGKINNASTKIEGRLESLTKVVYEIKGALGIKENSPRAE